MRFVVLLAALVVSGCWLDPWPGSRGEPVCENTCRYAYDGECDDGQPGALTGLCDYGSDCADCGTRGGHPLVEACPDGCADGEVCSLELGCVPRCATSDECGGGCCVHLDHGAGGCAPSSHCR